MDSGYGLLRRAGGLYAGFVFFLLCLINISISPINNQNIGSLQLSFVLFVLLCFYGGGGAYTWRWLALGVAVIAGFLLSHVLARHDGIHFSSLGRVYAVSTAVLFACALRCWLSGHESGLRGIAFSVALAAVVYFLVLAFSWVDMVDPVNFNWFAEPPLFRHIRHVAYFLAVAMVMSAWLFLVARSGWERVFAFSAWFLAVAMMFWSGSRGAAIAALLGVVFIFIFYRRDFSRWRWLAIIISMPLALICSHVFWVSHSSLGMLSALWRTAGAASADAVTSGRLSIWRDVVSFVGERPVWGWGGEAFAGLEIRRSVIQAHNGPLQLLLEWGSITTGLIFGLIFAVLLSGLRALRCPENMNGDRVNLGLAVALLLCLLALSAVDGIFYHGTPLAFLMLSLAATSVYAGRLMRVS